MAASAALPATAQERKVDPLTRFFDGLRGKEAAEVPAVIAPARAETVAPVPPAAGNGRKLAPATVIPAPPRVTAARPEAAPAVAKPAPGPVRTADPVKAPAAKAAPSQSVPATPPATKPVPAEKAPVVRSAPAAAPAAPAVPPVPAQAPAARSPLPSTPEEGISALNAHFNGIDQMMAAFVQVGAEGKRAEGTLTLQRPGRFRFAYSAPSTLEIISDGRNVAIRDAKLRTNDVYPVNQTPLKFLVQEHFDLAKHTKVRDVRTGKDGVVTAVFEDSTTLGGTSIVELTYDSKGDRLVRWVVTDPQGFKTTVDLNDVEIVRREVTASN